jgi:hypothetical protein
VISGGVPPAGRSVLTASPPSLAETARTGSSLAMRRSTVPRDGTRRPRTLHSRATSRHTAATVRRCRVRYRVRSTSRTTVSSSSGSRSPPRPPLEVPGSRSDARPSPARQRLTSVYTCRRETPNSAAATSAASRPTGSGVRGPCPVAEEARGGGLSGHRLEQLGLSWPGWPGLGIRPGNRVPRLPGLDHLGARFVPGGAGLRVLGAGQVGALDPDGGDRDDEGHQHDRC